MEREHLIPSIPTRYAGLDYLRGAMALAVLVFHFNKWLSGNWNPDSIPGRLGVYAVAIFFILSGLTLTLVYQNTLTRAPRTWRIFYWKRIRRIFPLLWLATAATLVLDEQPWSGTAIFLNFSGLFGFINPAADIATGAWSIGCELVYYAVFPFILLLSQRDPRWLIGIFVATFALAMWPAFTWFSQDMTDQAIWWPRYVQAVHHAFFFVGGMAIAVFQSQLRRIPRLYWYIIGSVSALLFCCWPVGNNAVELIYGNNRLFFSGISLLFTLAYFQSDFHLPSIADRVFRWLGEISYSVYLLHPLVFRVAKALLVQYLPLRPELLFPLALLLTLAASHLSYFCFEKKTLKRVMNYEL